MRLRLLFALVVMLVCAGPLHATIYAVDESGPTLYTIDPATGSPTLVAPITEGEPPSIVGLGWDSAAGRMYISDLCPGDCGLGTLDLTTGVLTYIGSHATTSNVHGLAYDSGADVLYGTNTEGDYLTVINRATGVATDVGPFGVEIHDVAYVPATDTLYGNSDTALYTIDRTTGGATLVGPFGASNMRTITWDPATSAMYAANGTYGDFFRVNLVTGGTTYIGDTGIQLDAIEAISAGGAAPPADVPALGGSSLALLALLLAVAGIAFLRFRA